MTLLIECHGVPSGMPSAIEVRELSKQFGPVLAVDDLSFEVAPGRVTGFLGPNGSGKTTTLRILLGLVNGTGGSATFGGRRYVDIEKPVHHVGAVLEATSFHPSRRAEDHLKMVAIGAGIPLSRVGETLDLVGLSDVARRRVGKFSMGMRQRLQLATALLGDPEILILDEPSNGLDPQGIQWLRTFIRHQASIGHSVLVSSHLLAEMEETVDDVVIVSHGRLVLQTTLAELATQAGTATGLRIRSPELPRLIAVLQAVPVAFRQVAPDTLVIDRGTPEWFGPLAAQHQIVLYELAHGTRQPRRGLPQPDSWLRCRRSPPGGGAVLAGSAMIASVRSEWLKIRTTAVPWVLAGIAIVINALLILVYFISHDTNGGGNGGGGNGNGNGTFGIPNYPHTTQQLRNLLGSGFECYLLALLLGVLIVTTEFRHKTVTTSFLVTPHRPRFVGAKLILAAVLGALLAVIMLVATLIGGGATLVAQGGSLSALIRQLPAVAPGMILVFALFGILGLGVGSVLTNQVAAIIVCLGWFIILEGILVGLVHGAERWVPTGAATAAANLTRGRGADFGLFNWWQGTLLMLAYGLVFAGVGSIILTRRDIT